VLRPVEVAVAAAVVAVAVVSFCCWRCSVRCCFGWQSAWLVVAAVPWAAKHVCPMEKFLPLGCRIV